MKIANQHNMLY